MIFDVSTHPTEKIKSIFRIKTKQYFVKYSFLLHSHHFARVWLLIYHKKNFKCSLKTKYINIKHY